MEEDKLKEPMVKILTAMPDEGSDEKFINYLSVLLQNSKIYIWSWQEFRSLLTEAQESLIEESANMIYYRPPPNQEEGRLSTKRKPMRENQE